MNLEIAQEKILNEIFLEIENATNLGMTNCSIQLSNKVAYHKKFVQEELSKLGFGVSVSTIFNEQKFYVTWG